MTARRIDQIARALVGPLMRLETVSSTGWRLVGWDTEQGFTFTLGKGPTVLLVELERRDDTRDCYARTARFNVCVRRQFEGRADLSAEDHRVVAQVVQLVRQRESLLPLVERPPAEHRAEVRELQVDRLLMAEGGGHYYVNPYVGCMIGCDFCYVADRADLSRALEGVAPRPWGRYVDVKVNAAEVLRREVRDRPPGVVRMSPILTDPYQPLERRHRITRQCLEVLFEAGFTPLILTRSARILDDLELLARFPRAAVGLSIPTDDDAMRRHFEPGGDPIEERFAALEACHRAGLRTFCVIQPMLPMDVDNLVARVAPHAHAVRVDRMHEMPRVRPLYEAIGRLDAAEDSFFERTGQALREGFTARGLPLDDDDDLRGALNLLAS